MGVLFDSKVNDNCMFFLEVVVVGSVESVWFFFDFGVDVFVSMLEMKNCLYLVVDNGYLEMV